MPTIPELVAYTGKLMFERRLTDISGGNVSALDGDSIVISPRFAGSKQHWHLAPEDLLCGRFMTDELLTDPRFFRARARCTWPSIATCPMSKP